jgi:hypothetical protein
MSFIFGSGRESRSSTREDAGTEAKADGPDTLAAALGKLRSGSVVGGQPDAEPMGLNSIQSQTTLGVLSGGMLVIDLLNVSAS